ncbi:MAG: PilW family protein [Phycisphaerales bacterium JB061]
MKRRGFTLIELVVSLSVVGILMTAIGSSIVISTKTLPTAGGFAEMQTAAGKSLTLLGNDIRLAGSVTMPNVRTLNLRLPDQDGDTSPEAVVYQWSGAAGTAFTREFNGGGQVNLLATVIDMKFTPIQSGSLVARGRTSSPADRIRVDISAGISEPVNVSAEYRLFNARVP